MDPHQFVISRDPSRTAGVGVRSSLWSDTELGESQDILLSLPDQEPMLRAGQHVFNRYKGDPQNVEAKADWEKCKRQLNTISEIFKFCQFEKRSWREMVLQIEEKQCAEARPYDHWFPLEPQDVKDALKEYSDPALNGEVVADEPAGGGPPNFEAYYSAGKCLVLPASLT